MDVYGRLFKSFVRSAAGCKHKLLSDIIYLQLHVINCPTTGVSCTEGLNAILDI